MLLFFALFLNWKKFHLYKHLFAFYNRPTKGVINGRRCKKTHWKDGEIGKIIASDRAYIVHREEGVGSVSLPDASYIISRVIRAPSST